MSYNQYPTSKCPDAKVRRHGIDRHGKAVLRSLHQEESEGAGSPGSALKEVVQSPCIFADPFFDLFLGICGVALAIQTRESYHEPICFIALDIKGKPVCA